MKRWIDPYDSEKFIEEKENVIIAKGGDGTLLRAVRMHLDKGKPFYGVAAGTENFLMNPLDSSISKKSKYKRLRLLKIKIDTGAPGHLEFYAFNDITIGSFSGWNHFNVDHKDDLIGKFKGSGIVLSTTQGSTGLNKHNGGTILPLNSKNWVVTGVQATKNVNYVIAPKKVNINCKSRGRVSVVVDGQDVYNDKEFNVEVSQGPEVIVIFNDYKSFKKKRQQI